MKHIYHDGGRAAAGFKGVARDCLVRALAITTGRPYQEVYDAVNAESAKERVSATKRLKSSARDGVFMATAKRVVANMGGTWVATSGPGAGFKAHMRPDELPAGRIIVRVSKHYAAVIDGVLYDNHDCTRGGTRGVYGYWSFPGVAS